MEEKPQPRVYTREELEKAARQAINGNKPTTEIMHDHKAKRRAKSRVVVKSKRINRR